MMINTEDSRNEKPLWASDYCKLNVSFRHLTWWTYRSMTVMSATSCHCLSQLCYGPVVTYCMVYHYTKRVTLARLLANEGPAIYVVHLNRYFVIPP